MSVILEFTIENDEFTLGRVLSGPPAMEIELERIVPTENVVMPFLWVTGEAFDAFERKVIGHEYVHDILPLDRIEDSTLYRVDWHERQNDLIRGIAASDGTILEGYADERWHFRIRFIDHDALSSFHNYCTDHGITIHIVRTYTEVKRTESVKQFGLTEGQREALVLGLRNGYFDTPSQASLDDLAAELDVSQQALSDRIRRGTKRVLSEALLASAEDMN